MTEEEKMNLGLWYDANFDQKLLEQRMACFDRCFEYNQLRPSDPSKYQMLESIVQEKLDNVTVLSPVTFDYGINTRFGKNVFVNINCYFMDGAKIEIGNNVFIGPYCGFYTANHPLDPMKRNQGLEQALPIKIEDDCWIGANVSIMPGVTIKKGSVIAAGSVVTKDVEANSLMAKVPATKIRNLKD